MLIFRIAESETGDPLCDDPVEEVAQQLDGMQDPELFKKYILWLVKRSPDRGLSILLAQNPKSGVKLDDAMLVDELHAIDKDAAHRYLEHVVVIKRSPVKALHQALLNHLLESVSAEVKDEGVCYHLEELGELSSRSASGSLQMPSIDCPPTLSLSWCFWQI